MAAVTIKVREALRRASVLLTDASPQFKRYPEQDMVDALNDGQAAISKYIPIACPRLDAIKLKPGALQSLETIAAADCKPQDGSTPAVAVIGNSLLRLVCHMGSDGATVGRSLRIIEGDQLDRIDPLWMQASKASATPREYIYDPTDPRHFLVNPPVHASTAVWVLASYTAQPVRVPDGAAAGGTPLYDAAGAGGGANTLLSICDQWLDDLVNYVVARLLMSPREWNDAAKAQGFATMFIQSINAQAMALTGVNPNLQRLPFMPEPQGAAR